MVWVYSPQLSSHLFFLPGDQALFSPPRIIIQTFAIGVAIAMPTCGPQRPQAPSIWSLGLVDEVILAGGFLV